MSRVTTNRQSTIRIVLGADGQKLVPIAQDVAIARAVAVCEVMFHVAAIRSLQHATAAGASALVECVTAHVQDRTAQGDHQAAHLLPGQIRVANQQVWQLASAGAAAVSASDLVRLEARTESCFAATWVLPAVFNRADSQAERMAGNDGLKKLFGTAVHLLWRTARVDAAQPLVIDRHAVITALQGWFRAVNDCYERAADRKRLAALAALPVHAVKADERDRERRILATYADSLLVASVPRFVSAHAPHLDSLYRFL